VKEKTFAKTIKLFLIDGAPNGRMSAELSNWTGKAYKIPRTMLSISGDCSDIKGVGGYMLFGIDPEDNKDMVYIGESEEVYERLRYHLENKEFWNVAIVFVSKDDNLNKAHLKYLESKMYERAIEVGRYKLNNANIPKCSSISEPDVAEMEEFFYNMSLLVSTLGYKLFDEVKQSTSEPEKEIIYYVQGPRGADARGKQTTEGFVVFEGSKVANDVVESFKGIKFQGVYNIRRKLFEEQIIKNEEGNWVFSEDYLFSSPSTAAMVVLGRSANGRTEWKTDSGKLLKDVEQEE